MRVTLYLEGELLPTRISNIIHVELNKEYIELSKFIKEGAEVKKIKHTFDERDFSYSVDED